MWTSNYATIKTLPPELVPVAISVGPPNWFKGRHEPRLCPTWPMLKMSEADYDRHFEAILAKLDPHQLFRALGPSAVLLCWEAPNVRCHRRKVAEWFEAAVGLEVCEYGLARQDCLPYAQMVRKAKSGGQGRRKKAAPPAPEAKGPLLIQGDLFGTGNA